MNDTRPCYFELCEKTKGLAAKLGLVCLRLYRKEKEHFSLAERQNKGLHIKDENGDRTGEIGHLKPWIKSLIFSWINRFDLHKPLQDILVR